jgi:hypothetical protein
MFGYGGIGLLLFLTMHITGLLLTEAVVIFGSVIGEILLFIESVVVVGL